VKVYEYMTGRMNNFHHHFLLPPTQSKGEGDLDFIWSFTTFTWGLLGRGPSDEEISSPGI
jgi:hypothetical protein